MASSFSHGALPEQEEDTQQLQPLSGHEEEVPHQLQALPEQPQTPHPDELIDWELQEEQADELWHDVKEIRGYIRSSKKLLRQLSPDGRIRYCKRFKKLIRDVADISSNWEFTMDD
jgi:hypothetical protein